MFGIFLRGELIRGEWPFWWVQIVFFLYRKSLGYESSTYDFFVLFVYPRFIGSWNRPTRIVSDGRFIIQHHGDFAILRHIALCMYDACFRTHIEIVSICNIDDAALTLSKWHIASVCHCEITWKDNIWFDQMIQSVSLMFATASVSLFLAWNMKDHQGTFFFTVRTLNFRIP